MQHEKMHRDDEALERMNYLYQAAALYTSRSPNLTRFYLSTMRKIGNRLVLRCHAGVKKTICRTCHMLLVPGVSASVRGEGKDQSAVSVRCLECQRVQRFRHGNGLDERVTLYREGNPNPETSPSPSFLIA